MNKGLKIFGLISLLCFSFYYTEKIALFMQSKDPIYESIEASKEEYKIDFVNATLSGEYIIPGLTGQVVNVEKSFQNMKNLGYFNVNELVFDETLPSVSLLSNKDKIIEKGNPLKYAVSFLLESDFSSVYFEEMGIPYAILTTKENRNKTRTYGMKINYDFNNYEETEKELKLSNEQTNYCFVTKNYQDVCEKHKKFMFKETISLNNSNFLSKYRASSSAGNIIKIEENLDLNNLKLLINQIYFQGLKIVSLNELLSESR